MKTIAFISYSTTDSSLANRVHEFLETNGCSCWIAPRDIKPGRPYGEEILSGIRSAAVLVVLISSRSTCSPHVRREVEAATSSNLAIIPLITDSEPIPDAIRYYLGDHQRIDATQEFEASFPVLLAAIEGIAGDRMAEEREEARTAKRVISPANRNPVIKQQFALVITDRNGHARTYPLAASRIVVGRGVDADIPIVDDTCFSRSQFALNFNAELNTFDLIDFGTVWGVSVNGQRVEAGGVVTLDLFDVIQSGDTRFEFVPMGTSPD